MLIRFDRGPLNRPARRGDALVIEGHAARIHRPGDPLRYTHGDEYRDAAELKRIVDQLPGKPVTAPHPAGLIRDGAKARIVGRVDAAWVDGEHAAVRISLTDRAAAGDIEDGAKELSLGYACALRADAFQEDTEVDHLAIVEAARCGGTCALRTDARLDCSQACACSQIDRSVRSGEGGIIMDPKELQARIDELTGEVKVLKAQLVERDALIATNAKAAESEAVKAEKTRADAAEAKVAKFDETFTKAVAARAKLEREAAAVMGVEFRLDDLTDRSVHEAVVKRLDASTDVKSVSDAELRGQFATLISLSARNAASQARVAEILGSTTETTRKDASESYEDIEKNRWKKTLNGGRTNAAEGR